MALESPPEGSTLTNRQLNRSLLARQFLLQRQQTPAASVIAHLSGMQSQAPKDPFIGLWTRVENFDHGELNRLMIERDAVRVTVMRGTIHLLTRDDAYTLRPVLQSTLEKYFTANATFAPHLADLDMNEILDAGRALLEGEPMTGKALGAQLAERWPDRDPNSLSYAVRYILPLVQITPRGVWGKSHQATLTTMQVWLGDPVDFHREPDEAIVRYLRAFGPATVADMQAWSGMTRLRESVERLRPHLVTYRDERNRELLDIPDAPFPDPETPAPIRFLPGFENALLSHADRTRIISEERRKSLWKANGLFDATFLRHGYVGGTWRTSRTKTDAELHITSFEPLAPADKDELESEGLRLLAFVEDKAENLAVHVNDPV